MIVGTAGHVDHGKTTLVRLLTGVDTDRLKEEKARGITTDLGFAYMPGPDGDPIGFIDVPGHESLVRTMVAGASGIDFALLVVAADEGIKPQTREHIEILRLLGIEHGLVAVSKADRADAARRGAIRPEIAAALGGSALAAQPPLFVSATTGEGLASLRTRLFEAAGKTRRGDTDGRFRLAVDRAFSLKGTGTIAAGTVISGRIAVDDWVTIMPGRIRCRVRSLHVQNRTSREGRAGDRCALALAGIARAAVPRGTWICGEATPAETAGLDVELQLSASEAKGLDRAIPVHLHCGASDVLARITSLWPDTIAPGGSGFARVALALPLPLRHGDRLVLRDTSARRTIGGAHVLDTRPPHRRRRAPAQLARLDALRASEPMQALAALLAAPPGFENLDAFAADHGLTPAQADALVAKLDLDPLAADKGRLVTTRATSASVCTEICRRLVEFHAAQPEQPGLSVESLRAGLSARMPKLALAALLARLVGVGRLAQRGHWLHVPGHVAQLGADERRMSDRLLPLIEAERFRPPRVRDLGTTLSVSEARVRGICKTLARHGTLVEVAHDHFFMSETVTEMVAIADRLSTRATRQGFTATDFRDQLENGRKVAIQILEFFDRQGLTRRTGDLRRLVTVPEATSGAELRRGVSSPTLCP